MSFTGVFARSVPRGIAQSAVWHPTSLQLAPPLTVLKMCPFKSVGAPETETAIENPENAAYAVLPVTSEESAVPFVPGPTGNEPEMFANVALPPAETFMATSTVPSSAPEYKLYVPPGSGANAMEVTASPFAIPPLVKSPDAAFHVAAPSVVSNRRYVAK